MNQYIITEEQLKHFDLYLNADTKKVCSDIRANPHNPQAERENLLTEGNLKAFEKTIREKVLDQITLFIQRHKNVKVENPEIAYISVWSLNDKIAELRQECKQAGEP